MSNRALAELAAIQYNINMHAAPVRGPVRSVVDLGELAARLGSINTFDRRGDTVWMDDFESGLNKWGTVLSGTGAAGVASNDAARNGEYSCKLTTGSTLGVYASIEKYVQAVTASKYGCEFSFTKSNSHTYISLSFDYNDGALWDLFHLRYDVANAVVQYLDENGAWQNLSPGVKLQGSIVLFNTLKLVVDPVEHEYVRAILNNVEFDMSGIACNRSEDGEQNFWYVLIRMLGPAGSNVVGYVDDVIITQNEPAN